MLMANSAAILTDAFPANGSAAWRWASTRSPASPASSSACCSAACWPPGTGGGLLGQRADRRVRHDLGLPKRCARSPPPARPPSTGWGNAPSRRAPACCSSRSPTASSPYGGDATGWTNPMVIGGPGARRRAAGRSSASSRPRSRTRCSGCRCSDPGLRGREHRPPARRDRPRRPPVHAGHLAAGIWLPLHGYDFTGHPAVGGHLHAAADRRVPHRRADLRHPVRPVRRPPVRHRRAARRGGRFTGLLLLPIDFPYWVFALLIFGNGIGSGLFASPNTAAIMSSVPAQHRGAASGMRSTFQNSGHVAVHRHLLLADDRRPGQHAAQDAHRRLHSQGVPAGRRRNHDRHLPPVSTSSRRCSATTRCRTCSRRPACCARCPRQAGRHAHRQAVLPHLISGPFHHGLMIVFTAAAIMSLTGAAVSLLRGKQFYYDDAVR
jgi:hypothetical protein